MVLLCVRVFFWCVCVCLVRVCDLTIGLAAFWLAELRFLSLVSYLSIFLCFYIYLIKLDSIGSISPIYKPRRSVEL